MKMRIKHAQAALVICILSILTGTVAFAQKSDFGSINTGPTKDKLRSFQMNRQWSIDEALVLAWPFRLEHSVCVMVRAGRVFLLADEAMASGVYELPVKPGDSFHRYSEMDVKAWNLPVVQEIDAIRVLKEEAAIDRKMQGTRSPNAKEAVRIDSGLNEAIGEVKAPIAPVVLVSTVTEAISQPASAPWSVVAVLIVPVIGLLWLFLKKWK